ncbi:cytochrome P450 [Mycolicibacterium llatzerense]|uniref:Cytochrome P450 n=1 Tax=Mycolicibacterium llatzerense TaxID=280871 RepID=A0A0D1LCT2_9MYCO|nr:cytochrome P450 [Mycolicibacterium llatzerense]KIU13751.1 cytochrome P450 [Mycolicibacterium llatzerense]MCT7369118.1 cytochrome P450 [Mycolicibacterium llatzerense]
MTTVNSAGVQALPLAPKNPLPYRQQMQAARTYHTGLETLRDAGGPVTRLVLMPRWVAPPLVMVTSPQGAHDVLTSDDVDRTAVHDEIRHVLGPNLFDLPNAPWLPRRRTLQPLFTKHHVRGWGGYMVQAAETVAAGWREGVAIDLDAECRRLTLRALGRAVLGADFDEQATSVAEPLLVALSYAMDRALAPVRAPRWLPTPARNRAQAASATLHTLAGEILAACRADPAREAPLVRALMEATDPDTGRALTDSEICDELIIFILAGHDTTATTLAYSLWSLGNHHEVQSRVADEVAALGARELGHDDVTRLPYTVQVLNESLRLCPPGAMTTRIAKRDIAVDGYRVEEGSLIGVGIYALHRDPALWERALEFDPDRFAPENSAGRDRWQYLPFGGGPRKCVGDHFAMLEATLALATLVRSHEITSLTTDFPMAVPFTTVAAAPILARAKHRAG